MKPIKINNKERKITLSSAFEKKAFIPGTAEYELLQSVRHDFAGFELETRQFKKNTKQERYKGLTYDFMRWYIENNDNTSDALAVFDKMLDISKAHSVGKRYPTIKSWFLDRYPEFTEFGMTEEEIEKYRVSKEKRAAVVKNSNVTPIYPSEKISA